MKKTRIVVGLVVVALSAAPAFAETLATVGKRTIDRAEVEKQVQPQLLEVENARYQALRGGLDELVGQALLEQEAAARGIKVEALVKTEIDDKVSQPTEAEIEGLYNALKERLGDASLESVRDRLVSYMVEQQKAAHREELLTELKKKYTTRITLRPPKIDVDDGGRASRGGGKNAPVTIIEFSDYECPFCRRTEPTVKQVLSTYGDKVRFVYRDYPLPFHANARTASEAAHCAQAQGKFWEYHDKLMSSDDLDEAGLKSLAKDAGLDSAKFDECFDQRRFKEAIDKDIAAAERAGVNGTPAFFINGRSLDGAQPFEKFKEVIDEELAWAEGGGSS